MLGQDVGSEASAADGRALGVVYVVISMLSWSVGGVFMRILDTDLWTTVAGRSMFGALFLAFVCFLTPGGFSRGEWQWIARPSGVLLVACQLCGQVSFVAALHLTSVANVALIGATLPFMAAMLMRILFGERLALHTLVAAILCLVGVAVI